MKRACVFLFLISTLILTSIQNIEGSPSYEDFTTYTEVDDDNKLTVATNKITWLNYERDDYGRVYKNYSSDYFGDVEHWFDLNFTEIEAGDATSVDAISHIYALDDSTVGGNDYVCIIKIVQNGNQDDQYKVRVISKDGGVLKMDQSSGIITDLHVYFVVERVGATLTVDVYSTDVLRDAGGDGDLTHLTDATSNPDSCSHVYLAVMLGSGGDPLDYTSGHLENLLFIEPPKITFYFNDGGILRLNNATISNGTVLKETESSILELIAIVEGNLTYGFNNFTWNEQTWNLLNETWDSLGNWTKTGTGTSIISPSGQLFQKSTAGLEVGRRENLTDLPSKYTVEFRHQHERFLDFLVFYNGEHQLEFRIEASYIAILNETGSVDSFSFVIDDEFHIWRLVMDSTNERLKVYFDDQFIKEWTSIKADSSNDGRIEVKTTDYQVGMHQDYMRIISGLYDYSTFSINNPFDFTVYEDNTVWTYFNAREETAPYFYRGFIIGGLIFFLLVFCIAIAYSKR